MLKVAPKPRRTAETLALGEGRHPRGDARSTPPPRVRHPVSAEPLDRRRGRQDGFASTAGVHELAQQILVRQAVRDRAARMSVESAPFPTVATWRRSGYDHK